MNDRISEFLKYLKIEKNYSSNTIKNYEIDIDEFKKMYENGEMTDNSTYVINHWEEVLKGRI